ncbi:MAG: glycoside hydrolase family 9 protein [Pseudomonadota bacterium]|nr:glycoside hydrolase family 9 protein [Pseudomonadota bacterium]
MRSLSLVLLFCIPAISQASSAFLAVNQIGYTKFGPKLAFVVNAPDTATSTYELVDTADEQVVFRLQAEAPALDPDSMQRLQPLDFRGFTRSGRYYVRGNGLRSPVFDIGPDVYRPALYILLRSYFLQRCGVPLNDSESGLVHAICHLEDAQVARDDGYHKAGQRIDAHGGWHDAGDYGKYVATTSIAVGRLLSLFEQFPRLRDDGWLNIAESGNGIPDLLDEAGFALDWMLKMQRADGAVYRKLSGRIWPPLVPPDEDTQSRYLYAPASSDTAKFAAAMAMAARSFRSYDKNRADRYLTAALAAWSQLLTLPEQSVDWHKDDDSGSGNYLHNEIDNEDTLRHDTDDRFWAAAELLITTGDPAFENYLKDRIDDVRYTLYEWKNPAPLGMLDYLIHWGRKGDVRLYNKIQKKIDTRAKELRHNVESSGYRVANRRFVWGSNKMTAEDGITLVYASRINADSGLLQCAFDQADYLLGRNPFNQSFVTGLGERAVKHVHHIFGRSVKRDVPGLLVGGPNENAQSGIAPKNRGILSYVDDERSYATNEYAIDYNAALIVLLALLEQSDA